MYETFFGLKRRPFPAVPDTESYFSVPQMEAAKQSIERAVRRGEGISLIVGPHGIGKTLLLRLLRKSLEVEYTVALVANGRLNSAKAFFQQLLYELHLPFSQAETTELRLALMDFARQETTPGVVLLFDEAQYLDRSVLEEILLLMNCDDGAMPFFRAVLAGTIDFEEKLTYPHLEAFNQRIVSRSYLDTMSREETLQYISWQTGNSKELNEDKPSLSEGLNEMIRNSGNFGRIQEDLSPERVEIRRMDAPHIGFSEPIFTDEARRTVYRLTDGLPRLVNQLCDGAMQIAAERIARHVDEDLIQSSWAQLQQIDEDDLETAVEAAVSAGPFENIEEIVARKKESFQLKNFDSIVEFGTLDDGDEIDSKPAENPDESTTIQTTETVSLAAKNVPSPLEDRLKDGVNSNRNVFPSEASESSYSHSAASVTQYKPPYPEDDEDILEEEFAAEEFEPVGELENNAEKTNDSDDNDETVEIVQIDNDQDDSEILVAEQFDETTFEGTESEDIEDAEIDGSVCGDDEESLDDELDENEETEIKSAEEILCLVDAVDEESLFENPVSVEESLEKLPFCEELNQAIEAVAVGTIETENTVAEIIATDITVRDIEGEAVSEEQDELEIETMNERKRGVSLRYPVRRHNFKWDGPRRYKQHGKKSHETQSETKNVERFSSLSLVFREFSLGDPWIGNVATRLLYQPGKWTVDAILSLAQTFENSKEAKNEEKDSGISVDDRQETTVDSQYNETNETEGCSEESDMDPETLKQYGAEVLEGRPPFVRKEPNYVYQTADHAPPTCPTKNTFPYFDPATGGIILLNWVSPHRSDMGGTGTTYRQFVSRDCKEINEWNSDNCSDAAKKRPDSPKGSEPCRIVRVRMEQNGSKPKGTFKRTIDERFDENVSVKRTVVSLEDIYRTKIEKRASTPSFVSKSIPTPVPSIAQQEIDAAVKRITDAAQKIEQAAETSQNAGQKISQSADFVETEIQAALPGYKELFLELSDFQQTISEELRAMKGKARAVEFVNIPSEPLEYLVQNTMDFQANEISQTNPPERGKLLPFPKRPDIGPPNMSTSQISET